MVSGKGESTGFYIIVSVAMAAVESVTILSLPPEILQLILRMRCSQSCEYNHVLTLLYSERYAT